MKKLLYSLFIVIAVAGVMASTVMAGYQLSPSILAGQSTFVGNVQINAYTDVIELEFKIWVDGWCMTESHVHAALTKEGIPQNKGGAIPGQFDFKTDHDGCIEKFTLEIPSEGLYGNYVYIAIHTVLFGPEGQEETGWTVNCGCLEGGQFDGRNWSAHAQIPADAWYTVAKYP